MVPAVDSAARRVVVVAAVEWPTTAWATCSALSILGIKDQSGAVSSPDQPGDSVPDPDPLSAQRSQTRGFLFADLRGYSAFTERHGDTAARDLLRRYRELVRDVIGRFGGAEIRTEGDSFYIVFMSVGEAVRAGLAIIEAADAASSNAQPVRVGIGVHAGETVDSAEGIVSSAVNIAARICSSAAAGEMLVSDTVRALTRTHLDVAFVSRGRRRLKGIVEPVSLYRVEASSAAGRAAADIPVGWAQSHRWTLMAGAAAAAAVAVVVVAVIGGTLMREGGASERFSPSAPVVKSSPSGSLAAAGDEQGQSGSPDASESSVAEPYPTTDEDRLLALVDSSMRDECERAAPEDGPVFLTVDYNAHIGGDPTEERVPVPYDAGIRCSLGGISAPDELWYWQFRQSTEFIELGYPYAQLVQVASRVGATQGVSCLETVSAWGSWAFGGVSGQRLCYVTATGDAVVEWTIDGSDIYGRAVRDDADLPALLDWWAAVARFGRP